jgi:hypothetical protein
MHDDRVLDEMRDRVVSLWGVDDARCAVAGEGLEFEV